MVKNIGTLIVDKHCKELCCGEDMKQLDYLNSAWLLIENGRVKDFGCQNTDWNRTTGNGLTVSEVDAEGGVVLPSFCDSHTHLQVGWKWL